nr:hypothetical protein [Paenibacillus alvei]
MSNVEKETIRQMNVGDNVTFGGVAVGMMIDRYEVHRVTQGEYKVGKFALMICLDMDYVSSTEEVISFIEGKWINT